MKLKHLKWIFLFFSWVVTCCTDPFDPGITDYEKVLVVEGLITDQPGPYRVTLSRTTPINSEEAIAEEGALVRISDDHGNEAVLQETSPGVYETQKTDIQGVSGRAYTLHIHTYNGQTFESEQVVLQTVPEIDSIYTTYQEKYSFDYNKILPGIQINVDTEAWDPQEDYYLKWDYEETWKIEPLWRSVEMEYKPCWKKEYNNAVLLENTSEYTSNQLVGYPLTQYSNESYKFFDGYSILVTQYALNHSAYQFWKMVDESSKDNGSIFDNVPFNPQSNIFNSGDDATRVFGYFDAAGVDQKRVYFETPLHGLNFKSYYSHFDCDLYMMRPSLYYNSGKVHKSWVLWENPLIDTLAYTFDKECIDCSMFTTTTKKPSFWAYD
mgnify:CR=1 FL=1